MEQPHHTPSENEAALDRDLERLRSQLDTLKSYLVRQPLEETLMDLDWETEYVIHAVFGSSSPLVATYDYAQIGEASGIVNLPQEAPEGVTHATEQETLRQRQRVLEMCIGDVETRRAALARGRCGGRVAFGGCRSAGNGPLRLWGRLRGLSGGFFDGRRHVRRPGCSAADGAVGKVCARPS